MLLSEKSVTLLFGAITLHKKKFNMKLKMRINRGGHCALFVVMWRALVWCQTLCASDRSFTKWTIRPIKSYSLFQLSTGHQKMHTLAIHFILLIILVAKWVTYSYSIMNLNTISLPTKARPTNYCNIVVANTWHMTTWTVAHLNPPQQSSNSP
jgi:uncharacterized protein with PQ loop repeat